MVSLTNTSIALVATFLLLRLSTITGAFTNLEYTEIFAPCLVNFVKDRYNVDLSVDDIQDSVSHFEYKAILDLIKAQNVEDADLGHSFATDGIGNCTLAYVSSKQWNLIVGEFALSQDCVCLELQSLTSNPDLPCDEIVDQIAIPDLNSVETIIHDLYKNAGFDPDDANNEPTYNTSLQNCKDKVNLVYEPNPVKVVNPDYDDPDYVASVLNAAATEAAEAASAAAEASSAAAENPALTENPDGATDAAAAPTENTDAVSTAAP